MSAYLFNGMDEWFDKHHASTFIRHKDTKKQSTNKATPTNTTPKIREVKTELFDIESMIREGLE
jgi:hypothetical protein